MQRSASRRLDLVPVTAALALVLGASGCQRTPTDANAATANTADADASAALPALPAAVPLATGAPVSIAAAPLAAALPGRVPARRARLADPRGGYAYLDRAYGQSAAADVAPPDYAFSYGEVRPWAWQAADRSREIVEPVPGGYRYYYYRPGADAPYLVRDPSYSYAYDGPALVAVYDVGGRPLPPDPGYDQALYAGRYLLRAQALYQASLRQRQAVVAADWSAHEAEVAAARASWAAQQARDSEWQAYHAEHAAEEQAYWAGERERRAEAAARFADWRARSFSGPPPVLYASAPPAPRYAPPPPAYTPPPAQGYAQPVPAPAYAPAFVPPAQAVRPAAAPHPTVPPPLATHQSFAAMRPAAPTVAQQPTFHDRPPVARPHQHEPAFPVEARTYPPAPSRALASPRTVAQVAPRPAPVRVEHGATKPERVIVARGADVPRSEPRHHDEPPHAAPPHFAPASHPVAVARVEPPHATPHPQPEHHADAHPEHHDQPHHEPEHHDGGAHEHR